jgi:hypothetical protein
LVGRATEVLAQKRTADLPSSHGFQAAGIARALPPERGKTVQALWAKYADVSQRDNDSNATDRGRAAHLLRHLGESVAVNLSQADVDQYRDARLKEPSTKTGRPHPQRP